MARTVLSLEGHTVLDESSANTGIAIARRERPDLILMDVNLPSMDGWTATRVIKSDPALAHIPIVAWTSAQIPDGEAGARAAGYDGYLPKPLDEDPGRQIKAWLDRSSGQDPSSPNALDPSHLQRRQ